MTTDTLIRLQQHLPFTVLKLSKHQHLYIHDLLVATAPTVYGIETTVWFNTLKNSNVLVATAPTVYGIET